MYQKPVKEMKRSDILKEQDHEQEEYTRKKNPSFPGLEDEEDYIDDDDDGDDDDADADAELEQGDHNSASTSRHKNGSTSSNSTVEESDKKGNSATGSVRPYVRSKNPRLRWTPELHLRFIHAVEKLGGQERATPKLVLQLMNIKGLSISHVKSHLQMYRSKKTDDPSQAVSEQRLLYESDDHHIYNFSQLPMLQSFSQRSISNFRYSDGLWNRHTNPDCIPLVGGLSNEVYGSRAERLIFQRNNSSNFRCHENNNGEESQLRLFGDHYGGPRDKQSRCKTQTDDRDIIINDQDKIALKRKAVNQDKIALKRKAVNQQDPENHDIDLNLSLQVKTREDDDTRNNEVNESGLSLSLFSSISAKSSGDIRRSKHAKTVGGSSSTTLDLTL
ncbi:hypothetical protein L2E82_22310 [Cichorium intybus]|uniref:Uncharacterized protein n=1 Tax=Cichorium intybus TaxID=13427 RepID=A0ACB9DXH6_CICIN|nr:hypothetical protein L2E82_22310 [Cichorium intybus]